MQDSGSFEEDSFRKKDVDCKPAVIVEISAKLSILRIPTSTLHYCIFVYNPSSLKLTSMLFSRLHAHWFFLNLYCSKRKAASKSSFSLRLDKLVPTIFTKFL